MSKFKVGDVVVLVSAHELHKHYIGTECEVLSREDYCSLECYRISITDDCDKFIQAQAHALRLKKPPKSLTTWHDIKRITNWSPYKHTVED